MYIYIYIKRTVIYVVWFLHSYSSTLIQLTNKLFQTMFYTFFYNAILYEISLPVPLKNV